VLVDLGAFDLLLKEAWNAEQAAMDNSTLPTVLHKLNIMSAIHLRKLIATLVRENAQRDTVIDKLEERIAVLEDRLNKMKAKPTTDVTV
jgi:hypothetical protein